MTDRFAIAATLREIAGLLQALGENPFKSRAYENGARALEDLEEDLGTLVEDGRLQEIDGVGEALAKKITELYRTGKLDYLEKIRAQVPPGYAELVKVPELGPKRIKALHEQLGIGSIADLEAACKAGKVRGLKGFGEKVEAKILEGIGQLAGRKERMLLRDALDVGGRIERYLKESPAVLDASLAGSARRMRETVGDLDVVVATNEPKAAMDRFVAYPAVLRVEARGDTKCTVRLSDGLQVDLRAVPPEDWATALHHFTGSKDHHVRLRGRARDRGLTISEWGVHRIADKDDRAATRTEGRSGAGEWGEKLAVPTEAELYRLLDLPYIPPELREDQGEIEAADAGDTFADLVAYDDLMGIVHAHTTFSDGVATVEEMARGAEALGMKYLTITDHSPTASYAKGVELDRLRKQWDEIDRVQELVGVRLLKGTESDILQDGALDYPDDVLERLDVVIASVHTRHKLDEDAMTKRIVRAMRHPVFKIWGHPLGRLLESRPPFAARVEEILDVIAESRAAVEINGDPHRLDLEPKWIRAARERGVRFVVSADAHSVPALGYVRYGVAMARKGGVRRSEVLNALPADDFAAAVRPA